MGFFRVVHACIIRQEKHSSFPFLKKEKNDMCWKLNVIVFGTLAFNFARSYMKGKEGMREGEMVG